MLVAVFCFPLFTRTQHYMMNAQGQRKKLKWLIGRHTVLHGPAAAAVYFDISRGEALYLISVLQRGSNNNRYKKFTALEETHVHTLI